MPGQGLGEQGGCARSWLSLIPVGPSGSVKEKQSLKLFSFLLIFGFGSFFSFCLTGGGGTLFSCLCLKHSGHGRSEVQLWQGGQWELMVFPCPG